MERIHTYSQLNVAYPEKEVFFRLGGNVCRTCMNAEQKLHFDTHAAKAFSLCRPQGRWMIKKVLACKDGEITLSGNNVIRSRNFSDLVCGAGYIWISAATVGREVVACRDGFEDISVAAIYDAVAGEVADSTMDMLQKMAFSELARCGLGLGARRYSPGYGDMSLEHQRIIFELLNMSEMGLSLTENCFMIPEKSVTSLAAVMAQNN